MRQAAENKGKRLFIFLAISVFAHLILLSLIHLDGGISNHRKNLNVIIFPTEVASEVEPLPALDAYEKTATGPKKSVETGRKARRKNKKKNAPSVVGQVSAPESFSDEIAGKEVNIQEVDLDNKADEPASLSVPEYTVANAPPIKLALSSSGEFINPDTNKIIVSVSDICAEAEKQGKFAPLRISYSASAKALGIDLARVATGEEVIVSTAIECEDGDDADCVGIGTVSKEKYEQMQQEEIFQIPNEKQITVGSEFPYCKDGLDDDGDGLVDFDDPDCHGSPTNIPIDNLKYLKPWLKAIENLLEMK